MCHSGDCREENDQLAFCTSYGQRTEARERAALKSWPLIINRAAPGRSIEHLSRIGGSSLPNRHIAVTPANPDATGIPSSYVPFRNAHLLAIATSWAEVIAARAIYIGAVAEDSSGYPDCRPEFYEAFARVIDVGTRPETRIEIRTPVIDMKKSEIVQRGQSLDAPFAMTWSCYQQSDLACGNCDSCALRLRAFREAGLTDPIPYALDTSSVAY